MILRHRISHCLVSCLKGEYLNGGTSVEERWRERRERLSALVAYELATTCAKECMKDGGYTISMHHLAQGMALLVAVSCLEREERRYEALASSGLQER